MTIDLSGGDGSAKLPARFLAKIEILHSGPILNGSQCWIWKGCRDSHGYGNFRVQGKTVKAHRWCYEQVKGIIPQELDSDHLCRIPPCVNPDHIEPVTRKVNCQRGIAGIINGGRQRAITHCPQGHPYSEQNTYFFSGGKRGCKICRTERDRKRKPVCPTCGQAMDRYATQCRSCYRQGFDKNEL